jgi:hypothetical protein
MQEPIEVGFGLMIATGFGAQSVLTAIHLYEERAKKGEILRKIGLTVALVLGLFGLVVGVIILL